MVEIYVKKSELKIQKKLAKKLRRKIKQFKKAKKQKLKSKIEKKKEFLQEEINRRKLLLALKAKEKRPVAIMRKIEDKIPPAFSEEYSIFGNKPRKPKPTYLEKGRLI